MNYEVEQKFRLPDAAALFAQLSRSRIVFAEPVRQIDQYFAHPARDFVQTDEALRIRSVGAANWVTYKGPKIDAATKTRRELELPIEADAAGAERFAELLTALGFRSVAIVRKNRRIAHCELLGHSVEVALDDVERVGSFCELEIQADTAGLDKARQVLAELATRWGLTEVERRSYLEMLLSRERVQGK